MIMIKLRGDRDYLLYLGYHLLNVHHVIVHPSLKLPPPSSLSVSFSMKII